MKKIFIVTCYLLLVSLSIPRLALAQESQNWATDQGVGGFWSAATSGQVNQEAWWAKSMLNTINFIGGALGGCNQEYDPECPADAGPGANGILASIVVNITTSPPVSSVEYLADLGKSLGIIPKEAYAQGLGFEGFMPILPLWKLFRNIAYLILVVIFVVIGFMIMFRKKLNPQTVISIQEAIPRIVVTLLLITFSYAIAGLVVDISELATRIIGNTFAEAGFIAVPDAKKTTEQKLEDLYTASTLKLVNPLRSPNKLTAKITETMGIDFPAYIPLLGTFSVIAKGVIWLLLWLASFYAMFKIFFALLIPYVSIILSVIFAPFQILVGAIPGSKGGVGNWLRDLLANVAVFPATFAMLCICAILKGYTSSLVGPKADWSVKKGQYGVVWAPATIGKEWGFILGDLISFGILLMTPNVVKMVKQLFEVKGVGFGEGAAAEVFKPIVTKIPGVKDIFAS